MPIGLKIHPTRIPGAGIVLQGIGLATAAYVGYKLYDFSAPWLLPKVPLTRDYYHDGGRGKGKGKGKAKAKAKDKGKDKGDGDGKGRGGDGPKAWALVTGASAGIGRGIATELALLGFGVVLLGHRADELSEAADAIRAEVGFSPSSPSSSSPLSSSSSSSGSDSDGNNDGDGGRNPVRTVVMDAITATYEDMERALLEPVFGALNVTILVNNVGGQPAPVNPVFRRLDAYEPAEADAIVDLNARFVLRLTRMALPSLMAATAAVAHGDGRALVLNVASIAGVHGMPGIATYSGSKAFVLSFTRALALETKADGLAVDVVALLPGEVRSQANPDAAPWSPDAREFARAVVATAGRAARRGQRLLVPWFRHAVELRLAEAVLPTWLADRAYISEMRARSAL